MTRQLINVLLVEDSQSDALLLKTFLQAVHEFDFTVDTETTLSEGVARATVSEYDAVILDLGLPDSVGLQTFVRMREQLPALPIVILSGNEDRQLIADAMERGADNYLIKDSVDGNRIAIAVLSAMRDKSEKQSV